MPVDPSLAIGGGRGADWSIKPVDAPPSPPTRAGFGSLLADSLEALTETQIQAAKASQALAAGQAVDPASVVVAVERAQLAMQLASQVRNKAVEAAQTILQTQV